MLKHLALFALFVDSVLSSGQTDAAPSYGMVHHRIEDADLGPVDIHLVDTLLDQKLPLVVFQGGSGAVPIVGPVAFQFREVSVMCRMMIQAPLNCTSAAAAITW